MIIYSVIARSFDGAVLVEATSEGIEGNHPQVTQQLIQRLCGKQSLVQPGNFKIFVHREQEDEMDKSLRNVLVGASWDDGTNNQYPSPQGLNNGLSHYFQVYRGEALYYICLSDDDDSRQQNVNFTYLQDIQQSFSSKFTLSKIQRANAYAMDKSFAPVLTTHMHHFNVNRNELRNENRVKEMTSRVESLKETLDENITLLLKRDVYIDNLIEQSNDLMIESKVFSKQSDKLKKVMRKKTRLYKMVLVAFGVFLFYFMLSAICDFDLSECRPSGNQGGDNRDNYYQYYGG